MSQTSTNATLETARECHCQGRLPEAENHYREVLRSEPDAVDALRGLGVLAYQHGRIDEAMTLFARGLAIRPEAADLHCNLAEVLRIARRAGEALDHATMGLSLDPTLADGWNTMGLLAHAQRRYGDAESAFREAIQLRPRHWSAHTNLGTTLQAMGRLDEAARALRTAIRLEPSSAAALTNLAQVLIATDDLDRLDEAEQLCLRALAIAPELIEAINSLGNVLRLQGRFAEALSCYHHALGLDPLRATPCLNIGKLFQERGRYDDAAHWFDNAQARSPDPARYHANHGSLWAAREQFDLSASSFRLALDHDPELAEAHEGLGVALMELGRSDQAEASFQRAIRIDPTRPFARAGLARLYAERGDLERSCHEAREALALRPGLVEAHLQRAFNLKERLPDSDIKAMEGLLRLEYLTDDNRGQLLFALAAIDDARGDYAAAAAKLKSANVLQAAARAGRGLHFDPADHSRYLDRIIATISPDVIARGRGWGDPDPRPVFVVGLPRSGSTLVEQIIASHKSAYGLGELPEVHLLFKSLPEIVGRPFCDPCEALLALDATSTRNAARAYLARLDSLAPPTAVRVVDKMLDNINLLGLIALLWPAARVILCRRSLRDVAVSCWQTGFASIHWANDHEHIARRFADYQRVVARWRQSRPLPWLEVSYRELVGDLEGQSRRVIDFLGLAWDPNCLQFHTTKRVVRTASKVQVREPIHGRSVGRWRHYDRWLEPLFQALERNGIELDDEE